MKIDRILLDVDGVLADWVAGVCRLFDRDQSEMEAEWGHDYDICSVLGCSTSEMWRRVDEAGEDFWANLEPYPWADQLYDLCRSLAPTTILTSPSHDPTSLAGKLRWLDEHMGKGEHFRKFLIGPDKVACARPGALLIDDRDANCDDFRSYGGQAIVFPRPWNVFRPFVGNELEFIKHTLAIIKGHHDG